MQKSAQLEESMNKLHSKTHDWLTAQLITISAYCDRNGLIASQDALTRTLIVALETSQGVRKASGRTVGARRCGVFLNGLGESQVESSQKDNYPNSR